MTSRMRAAARIAFASVLLFAGCERRSTAPGTTHASTEGEIVPAAVSIPARVVDAGGVGECSVSPAFPLAEGTGAILGVWRDPTSGSLFAASRDAANHSSATVRQVRLPHGELTVVGTLAAPAEAEITGVWRAVDGVNVIGYRTRNGLLHAARMTPGGPVEITFNRYDNNTRDRVIGPLDDPSESRAVGLLSDVVGFALYSTLCVASSSGAGVQFCSHYWPADSTARRVTVESGAVTASSHIVQGHTYGGQNSTAIIARGGSYSWEPLGAAPAPTPGSPYAYGYRRRVAVTSSARGGPMAAPNPGGAVAAWVNERGGISAQLISAGGTVSADPVALPFVDCALDDMAPIGGEVLMTLTTRADRSAQPATSTLLRLAPGLDANNPATVAPIRIPVADARLVDVNGATVVAWSPTTGNAVAMECRLSAL